MEWFQENWRVIMVHEWQFSWFTHTMTCRRCGLLPLDEDDIESECDGEDTENG